MLTKKFEAKDWQIVKPLFIEKMNHKGYTYTGPKDLIQETSIKTVLKAWQSSVAHQIHSDDIESPDVIINEVVNRIKEYL